MDNPCGAYELTKEGKIVKCKLYDNMSQLGAGSKTVDELYEKGYIEKFTNLNNNLLLVFLAVLILFLFLKKKYLYIV
jgi:hypothetical protein